jgi:hypothetical protein
LKKWQKSAEGIIVQQRMKARTALRKEAKESGK